MESTPLFELFEEDFKCLPAFSIQNIIIPDKNEIILKEVFNCIDLTSLNTMDSSNGIEDFCEKVADFPKRFPNMPNVAAVCVYPVFASILASKLKNSSVNRAVVSASFPSAQTFLETKVEETKRAVFFGANEVDIVISVGEFLEGNYEFVGNEISAIKEVAGKAHLKVILETGALKDAEAIWKASLLAMEAGADFIKTSTGKLSPAATPEAAWVMTHAIKAYAQKKSKMIGFKPAGGIATVEDALLYRAIQEQVLGDKWLTNSYFRIGASRLANQLLTEIEALKGNQCDVDYF
jgi:deoxyribose-phosphate aldolase